MITPLRDDPRLRDVRNFVTLAWRHLRLPDPTPVQYQIVHWMATGPDRMIIKGFRGIGKSWLCSAYCVWSWAMDPDDKIMVVSGSARRAGDFTTFTRQLIETWPLLSELRPGLNALRDSKLSFDVSGAGIAHAPSMTSLGVGGQLTGNRANKIIGDDVETESNSDTPTKQEKLAAHVQEFPSILSPGGKIIFLGTDQTEQSLYRSLEGPPPEGKGYSVRVWPVRYPDEGLRAALGDTLAPEIAAAPPELAGEPTDPARFPEEEILIREAELGRSRFNLQFNLDPRMSDADRFPIRLSDLVVMDLDPDTAPDRLVYGQRVQADVPCLGFSGDRYWTPTHVSDRWLPYQGKVLALDPAGRGKDETAACVVGQLNGFLYLLDMVGWTGEGYSDAVLSEIAAMAARYRVCQVVVEANFGDGMLTRLLEPHLHRTGHHTAIEEVKHSMQKERRILDTLEPVIQQHRLVVNTRVLVEDLRPRPGMPEAGQLPYRLAYQLSRITRERGSLQRDDRVDVLSIAAAFWRDAVAQDAARRVQSYNDQALMKEIARFHACASNPLSQAPPVPKGWLAGLTGRPGPRRRRGPRPGQGPQRTRS